MAKDASDPVAPSPRVNRACLEAAERREQFIQQMEFRPQVIRYLHDCYREDNSRAVLWDLLGSATEHLLFLRGQEELLDGFLTETPLPLGWASTALEAATTFRREKQLLYAAFPIIGRLALPNGKHRNLCAPLLTFPASIRVADGSATVSIERDARRINSGLLAALQSDEDEIPLADLVDAALDDCQISEVEIAAVARLVAKAIRELDASTMWQFPTLTEAGVVRAAAKAARPDSGFQLIPAACVCLVDRPTESRGVLTELEEIAEQAQPSMPLRALLGGGDAPQLGEPDTSAPTIPAVLSHSQGKILLRARSAALSLVIGPPGTGKSYTIAAIALDHLNRGESVLIASKMNHAVDVIANKIEDQLGAAGKVVRAGRRHYLRDLKHYVDGLLNNPPGLPGESSAVLKSLLGSFARLDAGATRLERRIDASGKRHLKWGHTLAAIAAGSRSIIKRLAGHVIASRCRRSTPIWEDVSKLHQLLDQRSLTIAEMVKRQHDLRIEHGLTSHRPAIKVLRAALGARTGTRQEKLFSSIDLDTLLSILPVWLVNLSDTHRALPNRRELFDVAIIDEASQCDIASCLPLLQRARRAVIVGDPQQLRHLSFLPGDRQREFATAHQLTPAESELFNYRNRSILDLASERSESQSSVNFLNEHFRSEPAIIGFSNRQFYSGRLHIMTEKPGRAARPAVEHVRCDGSRAPDGINRTESDAIIAAITRLVAADGETPAPPAPSIGVLSPFRAQVDHLAEQINAHFGNEIFERHQLLVGTAHTFQGEERELMFLSLAIDDHCHAASLRFLERRDLFNVAITRARQRQLIFTSFDPTRLPTDSLVRQFLTFIESANEPAHPEADAALAHLDQFAAEVQRELVSLSCQVWLGCPVAGLKIDLLAVRGAASLAIDLIGCPGPTAHVFPLERYKMFRRAGLTLWPLPYTDWVYRRKRCLEAIDRALLEASAAKPAIHSSGG